MKREGEETGRYFQAVSRFFLEHRGAPFYLSSEDVETIREWKDLGIPLVIVLEGIKDCFMANRKRPGRRGKVLSLSFCQAFVLQGFDAHKQRWVGRKSESSPWEDKRGKLKKAVERFLESCPKNFVDIRNVYSQISQLTLKEVDERILEDLEHEVEALIPFVASESERNEIKKEVLLEFGDKGVNEQGRILELKLIKHIREKYAIPHIPLYYY